MNFIEEEELFNILDFNQVETKIRKGITNFFNHQSVNDFTDWIFEYPSDNLSIENLKFNLSNMNFRYILYHYNSYYNSCNCDVRYVGLTKFSSDQKYFICLDVSYILYVFSKINFYFFDQPFIRQILISDLYNNEEKIIQKLSHMFENFLPLDSLFLKKLYYSADYYNLNLIDIFKNSKKEIINLIEKESISLTHAERSIREKTKENIRYFKEDLPKILDTEIKKIKNHSGNLTSLD